MKAKGNLHYAWIILLAMCVIRSVSAAGINNTGGLFLTPVATELGIGVGNLSLYFSVSSLATLIFMPFGGKLIHKFSTKFVMIVAAILQAGSFTLLGYMSHVWGWYVLSIPMGIGGAILVNLMGPILINRWFHKHAGLALGLLMASMGLFGTFLQPIVSNIIVNQGWRQAYILPGLSILIIMVVITFFFIKGNPEEKGLCAYGSKATSAIKDNKNDAGISFSVASKSFSFYALLIFMITITAFGAFNQHLATYGASLGYALNSVGFALSFSMIGSTIGALLIGAISDRLGVYRSALFIIFIVLSSLVCLMLGSIHFIVFACGAFLLGLGSMGIPVLAPLLTKAFFGEKDYETIYASVMIGPPLASIVLLPLYGFIYDATSSYRMVFILLIVLILIGGVSLLLGQKKRKELMK